MYIFKPSRYLIDREIGRFSHYIKGRVLDVGAGHFDRYGPSFEGATEYLRMDIEGADITGSIYAIPFKDEEFDSLVCTQVFEHLKEPKDGAKELFRVLKSGGHLLVTVPQWNELHEEPHDYFRYTKYGVESLFGGVGFELVGITPLGGYHSMLAQTRIRYWIDRFSLYQKPVIGRIIGRLVLFYGRYMVAKDERPNKASIKHTIGWCALFTKK